MKRNRRSNSPAAGAALVVFLAALFVMAAGLGYREGAREAAAPYQAAEAIAEETAAQRLEDRGSAPPAGVIALVTFQVLAAVAVIRIFHLKARAEADRQARLKRRNRRGNLWNRT